MHAPGRTAQFRQPTRLERPRAADPAGQLSQCETVDRLAHPGAGVVLGRRDPAVMTAPVLDREVPVRGHREHEPRQPLLERGVLVTELVRGVQPQTGVGAGDIGQDEERPPRQVMRAGPPGTADQGDEVQWHRRPGQPAVVAIGVELSHDRIGRVVRVFADDRVQQRHQAVADQQRDREGDLVARDMVRREADEGDQRPGHRQHPCPALAVAVADAVAVGCACRVGDGHGLMLLAREVDPDRSVVAPASGWQSG